MTTTVLTQGQFYEIYKNEVTALAPEFTDFSEGSIHDILNGAISIGQNEISELIITEFMKTYFSLASGADLDFLAVDHFGNTFKRPDPVKSTGLVTFSRANNSAGNVVIAVGTVVKTKKNSSGEETRYMTTASGTLSGLTISLPIEAVVAGVAGNVNATFINVIETALTDGTVTVVNAADTAGGKETLTDEEYRDFIKAKILSLAGATEAAIVGAALAVPGVAFAKPLTIKRVVIDYDIANAQIVPSSTYFTIPYPVLYIADAAGNSSPALIEAVRVAIFGVKAAGVKVDVKGAVAITLDWTGSLTLNVGGPNYTELSSDLSKIVETMETYINEVLQIGETFNKGLANAYVMSIWGPSGTGDLSQFSTSIPSGNVSIAANQKLVSGNVGIV